MEDLSPTEERVRKIGYHECLLRHVLSFARRVGEKQLRKREKTCKIPRGRCCCAVLACARSSCRKATNTGWTSISAKRSTGGRSDAESADGQTAGGTLSHWSSPMLGLTQLSSYLTLKGSFSGVSKPTFACVGKLSPRSTKCTPLHRFAPFSNLNFFVKNCWNFADF